MVRNKTILKVGILLAFFCSFLAINSARAEDTTAQILTQVDEILAMNPPKDGEKAQMIKVAQTDAVSVLIIRLLQGAEVKPHYHKTHEETVYVIKGSGQMLVNDKWVELKAGTIHFNPMNAVHSVKNTAEEPLVAVSVFTPSMKEPDRHLVK
ncbi:MAG TPA: cupin domain-containing protein [Desulfomonilaceae bacterium]|nr:cupin domain-containing protein [Desulfomonilaceae bacterium]